MAPTHGIHQTAEKYRSEGYDVVLMPSAGQLPPFAAGHDVDLLARKTDENVLVRVKADRKALESDHALLRLAEAMAAQPDWRLDLVVLNEAPPAERLAPEATESPVETIQQSLARAEQLADTGDWSVASILSWSAFEAAMRHAGRSAGIEVRSGGPVYLLRALYSRGLLDRSEVDHLDQALKVRNALVHGFTIPTLDPATARYVVRLARKLLAQNGQKQPA
jgi:hypothetical protein